LSAAVRRFGVALTAAAAAALATGVASARAPGARSHPSRWQSSNDNIYFHLVHLHHKALIEEGRAFGALPGRARVALQIGDSVRGSLVLYPRSGILYAAVSARTHKGRGDFESFSGSLYFTSGSGAYRSVRGREALFGVFDRVNRAVVLQLRGGFVP